MAFIIMPLFFILDNFREKLWRFLRCSDSFEYCTQDRAEELRIKACLSDCALQSAAGTNVHEP